MSLGHNLWAYAYLRKLYAKNPNVYYATLAADPALLLPVRPRSQCNCGVHTTVAYTLRWCTHYGGVHTVIRLAAARVSTPSGSPPRPHARAMHARALRDPAPRTRHASRRIASLISTRPLLHRWHTRPPWARRARSSVR